MSYHEPVEELGQEVRNVSRAINSFKEELEAIDWYHQRVATCSDPELKKILAHNRDEEIEHACMVLEWLRKNMPGWDEQLRTYLFSKGDVTDIEEGEESNSGKSENSGDLGIGSLKDK